MNTLPAVHQVSKLNVQNNGTGAPHSGPRVPYFSFKPSAKASEPIELSIYGAIGTGIFSDEGVGAKDFADQLKKIPKTSEIKVRIDSPGGNVHEGMTIHNLLAERRQYVDVVVDGVAASIASVVALSGRSLQMPRNAMLMIHDPSAFVGGTADDLRKAANVLDKHRDAILSVYEHKTGKPADELKQMMHDETWMTGDEAKAAGFCDSVTDEISFQAKFDFSACNRVPESLRKPALGSGDTTEIDNMNRIKIIAALKKRGVTIPDNATDDQLMAMLEAALEPAASTSIPPIAGASTQAANKKKASSSESEPDGDEPMKMKNRLQTDGDITALRGDLNRVTAHLEAERKTRISGVVDTCIAQDRIPAGQRDKWVTRAIADETVLDDLRAMEPKPPGAHPVGVIITGESPRDLERGLVNLRKPIQSWMRGNLVEMSAMSISAIRMATELNNPENRKRLGEIMNANTIDEDLKRNVILNDQMRAFKRKILMLTVFSTKFTNVPLEGTNKILMPFYELDTTASKDFDPNAGYVFDQDTSVGKRDITIDRRKYKPMDFSSDTFRRQPYFNPSMSMLMKAEQLAVDVWTDVLSLVTQANYGAAVLSVEPGVFDVDDVIAMEGIVNAKGVEWPDMGRTLVLSTTHKTALLSDNTLKFFQNAGNTEALRNAVTGQLLNFDMMFSPRIPDNGEDLGGFACLPQAILIATAPIAPAPGVRARLLNYDLVVDPDTGIAFEYRYWGEAVKDRDHEVVECNYGFKFGNAAALKRITMGAGTNSSSSSASSVNSSSSSSSS